MKVEIAFDLAANGQGSWFTLDDTTKGELDNTTYLLAGDVLVDVTSDARAVQVRRGRSRTLDKFTAGNANITLDNRDRSYDPTNVDSPYYGSIVPRKQVVISHNGYPIYTGSSEDWNFGYTVGGDSTAEVSCVDGFTILASATRTGGTATAQATGARVGAVLDEIGWPTAMRSISTGQATLDADVVEPTANALAYLQQVELSEPGALFIGKGGNLTFRDRADLQAFTSGVTFGTGGIPFTDIGVVYGTEEMTNTVNVVYSAGSAVGGTATATDATAVAAYGVMEQTYDTLLGSSADAANLGAWLVGLYSQPQYRVDSIGVNLAGLTSAQVNQVLALELGDNVLVTWTPNAMGSAISQYASIDSIEHQASPRAHTVTLTMSESTAAFILDDATWGVLDDDRLGF
jgi:hypothetical protein